jgi:hypothetical protein
VGTTVAVSVGAMIVGVGKLDVKVALQARMMSRATLVMVSL